MSEKQNNDDESIVLLLSMGFDEQQAKHALSVTAGNAEQAINYLLSGGGEDYVAAASTTGSTNTTTTTTTTTTPNTSMILIQGTISQYSMENGRSACTCMALVAAREFLKHQQQQQQQQPPPPATLQQLLDANFIDTCIRQGSQMYQEYYRLQQQQTAASTSSSNNNQTTNNTSAAVVEHASAEDLLPLLFPELRLLDGGIRQGTLSHQSDHHPHPLGLHAIFAGCQQKDCWIAVVLTKTPETLLVLLPPTTTTTTSPAEAAAVSSTSTTNSEPHQHGDDDHFIIVDSHPRPPVSQYASIQKHGNLQSVVCALTTLFPATNLGPDIPELMNAMYNSFDAYPLEYVVPASDPSSPSDRRS